MARIDEVTYTLEVAFKLTYADPMKQVTFDRRHLFDVGFCMAMQEPYLLFSSEGDDPIPITWKLDIAPWTAADSLRFVTTTLCESGVVKRLALAQVNALINLPRFKGDCSIEDLECRVSQVI